MPYCSFHISLPWLFPYCVLLITAALSENTVSDFLKRRLFRKGPAIAVSVGEDSGARDCADITDASPCRLSSSTKDVKPDSL